MRFVCHQHQHGAAPVTLKLSPSSPMTREGSGVEPPTSVPGRTALVSDRIGSGRAPTGQLGRRSGSPDPSCPCCRIAAGKRARSGGISVASTQPPLTKRNRSSCGLVERSNVPRSSPDVRCVVGRACWAGSVSVLVLTRVLHFAVPDRFLPSLCRPARRVLQPRRRYAAGRARNEPSAIRGGQAQRRRRPDTTPMRPATSSSPPRAAKPTGPAERMSRLTSKALVSST